MFLKLAWRNIWRNKRRTFITMASIVFALLLAILLNSVKEGVLYKMQENVVTFYTGAVQVHRQGYWEEQTLDNSFKFDEAFVREVVEHKSVNNAIARLESFALSTSEDYSRGCMVVGIEPALEPLVTALDQKISAGSYLNGEDKSVLLAEGLADYLKLGVNDTVVLMGQGYHGISAAAKYPVKGLIHFASPELNKSMVYLPIREAQWLFGAPDLITALVLQLDDVEQAEQVERDLQSTISSQYEVMNWKILLPELDKVIEGERAENVIFLVVLYLLISFGIFGTVLMMTMERQYEFGILTAIGMKKIAISGVVILENVMISALGALIGTLLSIPVVGYFYKFPIKITGELQEAYENFGFEPIFYFSIAPRIFYSQTIIVLSIALVMSVYPLLKINRLEPVEAMRQ